MSGSEALIGFGETPKESGLQEEHCSLRAFPGVEGSSGTPRGWRLGAGAVGPSQQC